MAGPPEFQLTQDEHGLLFSSVPNEVLHGFRVPGFQQKIGVSEIQFSLLMQSLENGQTQLDDFSANVAANALAAVLIELGEGEFQTRTGVAYSEGLALLNRLNPPVHNMEQHGAL